MRLESEVRKFPKLERHFVHGKWRIIKVYVRGSEVAAAGRAAIFIPFGAATDSHQLRNAQEMARAGAGRVIPEPELTPERLTSEIFSLLDQPQEIEKLSENARRLARPTAARDIVTLIEGVVRPRGGQS